MRTSSFLKTVAAGVGLSLLLAAGAQAQALYSENSGGVNAKALAAQLRSQRILDRVDAALRRDAQPAQVISLALAPDSGEGHELCGMAYLGERRFAMIHVADVQNLEGSLSVTPVAATLNGLAVAHNDVYSQCGGVGRARVIVENHGVID